jgi:hypothetical protein
MMRIVVAICCPVDGCACAHTHLSNDVGYKVDVEPSGVAVLRIATDHLHMHGDNCARTRRTHMCAEHARIEVCTEHKCNIQYKCDDHNQRDNQIRFLRAITEYNARRQDSPVFDNAYAVYCRHSHRLPRCRPMASLSTVDDRIYCCELSCFRVD